MTEIEERGPWRISVYSFTEGGAKRVDVQSDDFEHDVALTVSGDFESLEQKIAYAEEIARRLNAWQPHSTGDRQYSSDNPAKPTE